MQRIRLTYSRGEELLYIGNLDMQRAWERTFRRADLNLAYSQGFHPQPRIHQACPLPLGFTSSNEILDFWLDSEESIAQVHEKLEKAIQPGIIFKNFEIVPLNAAALQTEVVAAKYQITFEEPTDLEELKQKTTLLLSRPNCFRERRGKQYDLLPLIKEMKVIETSQPLIEVTLTTLPGATGRPEEILDELSIPVTAVSINRCELIFESGS